MKLLEGFRKIGRTAFRAFLATPGVSFSVDKMIGQYGPFRMDGCFLFSDFSHWNSGKNVGFALGIQAISPGDTVLDIGGHVGLFTLPAAQAAGPSGRVVSFEPGPRNLELLRRHVALNGLSNVEVVGSLVGDGPSTSVSFFVTEHDSGLNSLVEPKPYGFQPIAAEMTSVDDFCGQRKLVPNLIKLDIEGGELAALRGAREVLSNHRPSLLLSVHPWHLKKLGHSVADVQALLQAHGYQAFDQAGHQVSRIEGSEYLVRPV